MIGMHSNGSLSAAGGVNLKRPSSRTDRRSGGKYLYVHSVAMSVARIPAVSHDSQLAGHAGLHRRCGSIWFPLCNRASAHHQPNGVASERDFSSSCSSFSNESFSNRALFAPSSKNEVRSG
jgi:hypothetical protein